MTVKQPPDLSFHDSAAVEAGGATGLSAVRLLRHAAAGHPPLLAV